MTKSLLAATLILFALMFASVAFATGYHHIPIVKPPVVVPPVVTPPVVVPPVVAPPVVTAPVVPPVANSALIVADSAPAQQPVYSAAGGDPVGPFVFAGVAIFFWAVVCVKEREVNPDGFWASYLCLPRER